MRQDGAGAAFRLSVRMLREGLEINPFAAELARVSVWIGEIQWMREHGFDAWRNPILKPLDTIECRDALLNVDGSEAEWPEADVIIGNPPFLATSCSSPTSARIMSAGCFRAYDGRVPREADLVCYSFQEGVGAVQLRRSTAPGWSLPIPSVTAVRFDHRARTASSSTPGMSAVGLGWCRCARVFGGLRGTAIASFRSISMA